MISSLTYQMAQDRRAELLREAEEYRRAGLTLLKRIRAHNHQTRSDDCSRPERTVAPEERTCGRTATCNGLLMRPRAVRARSMEPGTRRSVVSFWRGRMLTDRSIRRFGRGDAWAEPSSWRR